MAHAQRFDETEQEEAEALASDLSGVAEAERVLYSGAAKEEKRHFHGAEGDLLGMVYRNEFGGVRKVMHAHGLFS